MARDDADASAAQHDVLDVLDRQAGWVDTGRVPLDYEPVRLGGPVVAGPPDDAWDAARLEIMAALGGDPTPGGI